MVQNLDDCYVHSRLPNGTLVPDPVAFPSGMRALADYVHSKQMLFGVYTARCAETCAGRPASLGHEAIDAHTFAIDWDADYLKEDSCRGCTDQDPMELYMTMEAALNATGKPVRVLRQLLFSIPSDQEIYLAAGTVRYVLGINAKHVAAGDHGQLMEDRARRRELGQYRAQHRYRLRPRRVRRAVSRPLSARSAAIPLAHGIFAEATGTTRAC